MVTPLPELPSTLEAESSLAWQFEPSAAMANAPLGLYTNRLMRAAHVGGFGKVVTQTYLGEQATYTIASHNINEIYPGDTAAGDAAISETRAEPAHISMVPDNPRLFKACQWPTAYVKLNRNDMASQVATAVQNGIPQNKAWATILDTFLRHGVRKAAWKKLKNDFSGPGEPFMTSGSTWLVAESFIPSYHLYGLICMGALHAGATIMGARDSKRATGSYCLDRKQWSIFPVGIQPDRFALAAGLLSTQRLVCCLD